MIAKFCFQMVTVALLLSVGIELECPAQETDDIDDFQSTVDAPASMREMGFTLGGAYFVNEDLLDRYESLKARLSQVRNDILRGDATSDAAKKDLAAIQKESGLLRKELEERKVLVAAFHLYSKTTEETFPLGDERLVVITGDNVTIRGWKGPGIKCVVEKTIIAKEQPDDSEFDAIHVNHDLRVADEEVGPTKAQLDEHEKEFLKSEAGRELTNQQKAGRRRLLAEIYHSHEDFQAFQGHQVNTIRLTGLTSQEGNRNLILRFNSPGGGSALSSQWQRHAKMTVYVPSCKSLAIRGCQVGLDIRDIECDLVLTTADSWDRDYEGVFAVRGVKGNVTIDQAPLRVLSDVQGNVRFTATNEFVNSGTACENDTRTFSTYETHQTQIDHIDGGVSAEFLRTDLKLNAIKGVLNIDNHFGTTHLTLDAVDTDHANRIVSESGTINVVGDADVLKKTPIYAYTQCGRLRTNLAQDILDAVSFSTGRPQMGWQGFVTPSQKRFSRAQFERPAAALENRDRAPGLDLISRAGMVSILTTNAAE